MDQSSPDTHSVPIQEARRRGALVLRTLPILLISLGASVITIMLLLVTDPPPQLIDAPIFSPLVPIAIIVIFCSALIMLVRSGRPTVSALVLIGVWTLFTTVGTFDSGITTYTPALLILPICAAGLLIDRVASMSLAALAVLLVSSSAWLESQGITLGRDDAPGFVQAFMTQNQISIALGFWIGLFVAVAALTSLLAGSLQRALHQSYAQADELRRWSGELEARVAAQTAKLLDQERTAATLEERTRLAREIHDTLAQGLAGITVQLGAAQRARASAPAAADEHLALAQQMARESLVEARRSVWNLRAPALERGDIGDALRGLVERPDASGMERVFTQQGAPWPLPPDAESALLRVAQAALANVAKHATAQQVAVVLEYTPDAAQLSIHDNGAGFDTTLLEHPVAPGPWSGFGLLGMRERLSEFGGTLELVNNAGACVIACVPKIEM